MKEKDLAEYSIQELQKEILDLRQSKNPEDQKRVKLLRDELNYRFDPTAVRNEEAFSEEIKSWSLAHLREEILQIRHSEDVTDQQKLKLLRKELRRRREKGEEREDFRKRYLSLNPSQIQAEIEAQEQRRTNAYQQQLSTKFTPAVWCFVFASLFYLAQQLIFGMMGLNSSNETLALILLIIGIILFPVAIVFVILGVFRLLAVFNAKREWENVSLDCNERIEYLADLLEKKEVGDVAGNESVENQLLGWKELYEKKLITKSEYERKKKKLLGI